MPRELRPRPRLPFAALLAAGCTALALAGGILEASASHVACGASLTESVVFDENLDCPADGLVVAADGVVVDLAGHTLTGANASTGIAIGAHAGVLVKNGTIQNFQTAISNGGAGTSISRIRLQSSIFGIDSTAPVRISDSFVGNTDTGIRLVDDSSVLRTRVVGGNFGIQVIGGGNVLSKSTIAGNGNFGIFIGSGIGNSVAKCVISANEGDGIHLLAASGTQIQKNLIVGNGGSGIVLENADDNAVSRNTVTGNVLRGIAVENDSDGNTVEKNVVTGNRDLGIFVTTDSDGAAVSGNRASRNRRYGIDCDNASPSVVISKNRIEENGLFGLEADPANDGGGNKASGNGNGDCSAGLVCQ